MYVLVIEDDRFNRTLYRDLLEAEGFVVEETSNAAAGLARAREAPPALVVMDIELPGLDGLEATQTLKADPRTQAVPVLVISAHANPALEADARAAGADAFSNKPLRFPEFQRLVRALVDAAGRP